MSSTQLRLLPTGPVVDGGTPLRPRTDLVQNVDRLWSAADANIELTVVVPFYNPGPGLRRTVSRLAGCLRTAGVGFEIIAVSDGSTDESERTLVGLGPEVRVVVSPVNQGKGGALHLGMAQARGAWVGFVDADGDIDPTHLVDDCGTCPGFTGRTGTEAPPTSGAGGSPRHPTTPTTPTTRVTTSSTDVDSRRPDTATPARFATDSWPRC